MGILPKIYWKRHGTHPKILVSFPPPHPKQMNGNEISKQLFAAIFDPPPASKAAGVVSPNTERTTPKANLRPWQKKYHKSWGDVIFAVLILKWL